jgi:hypothetical protein
MTMESHVGGPADRSHIANIMGIGEAGLSKVSVHYYPLFP